MGKNASTTGRLSSLTAVLLAAALSRPGAGQVGGPLVRYYQGQQIQLDLDTDHIAVFIEGDDGTAAANALIPFGFGSADVMPMAVQGWSIATTPVDIDTVEEIVALVGDIADTGTVDLVTPAFFDDAGSPALLTQEILVRFTPETTQEAALQILDPDGDGQEILAIDWAGMTNAFLVDGLSANGLDVLAVANTLAVNSAVEWSEVNWLLKAELHVDDPWFDNDWGLLNQEQEYPGVSCLGWPAPNGVLGIDMRATLAWSVTIGSPDILVAIFDSGIKPSHPDINQVPGFDLTSDDGDGGPVNECDTHGTPVAGTVSAMLNGIGAVGVAPGARCVSMRVMIAEITPDCEGNKANVKTSWIVQGLVKCQVVGARVTNHSYGLGWTTDALETKILQTKLNENMVHFASTGNDGDDVAWYPALLQHVIGVGAIDPDGTLSPFSNFETGLYVTAPGTAVPTTFGASGYGYFCGTSAAAPCAAGVAALMLSADPALTWIEVETILADTATDLEPPGYDIFTGFGLVNAYEAVKHAAFDGSCVNGSPLDCLEPHSMPGCNDEECCVLICLVDPFCCDGLWDQPCVDLALELCAGCGVGPCDEPHGGSGCGDPACCLAVCDADALCCDESFGWDEVCVALAIDLCDLAPANDGCEGAVEIFDGFTPFDISSASNDGPAHLQCNWDPLFTKDIWYVYTATCTGTLTVSACTDTPFDTWVGLYEGCACPHSDADLVQCSAAEEFCTGGSVVSAAVTAGSCYSIRVAAGNPFGGGGQIHIECSTSGDGFGEPLVLGPFEGTVGVDTSGATTDGPAHAVCNPTDGGQIHDDVWFAWTATCNGTLTADLCGAADFDTRLAVYDDTGAPSDATLLGCNDDDAACPGGTSVLSVPVADGACYLVRVGGAGPGVQGTGQMTIGCDPACPADIVVDGVVGILDFLALLADWGGCDDPCPPCPADLDGDCTVGILDLLELLASWGPCP